MKHSVESVNPAVCFPNSQPSQTFSLVLYFLSWPHPVHSSFPFPCLNLPTGHAKQLVWSVLTKYPASQTHPSRVAPDSDTELGRRSLHGLQTVMLICVGNVGND